jgi:hypothetical protein
MLKIVVVMVMVGSGNDISLGFDLSFLYAAFAIHSWTG